MGNSGEDADASPVKIEKKSKKNKKKINDQLDVGDGNELTETEGDIPKKKSRKHKEKKKKTELNENENVNEDQQLEDDGDLQKKYKKKKKRKRDSFEKEEENELKDCDPKPEKEKKKKKHKHKHQSQESQLEKDEVIDKKKKKKKKETKVHISDAEEDKHSKENEKKKKKKKKEEETKSTENEKEKEKVKGKKKKVSFSGQDEIFPLPDADTVKTKKTKKTKKTERPKPNDGGLVRGKRFTPEEDLIVKEAVLNYIEARGLGEEGLKIVLNCKSYPGMKKCWLEIGTCIPYRPHTAIYNRAHVLFERNEDAKWTPEDIEFLKKFQAENGNQWKVAGEELGKHRGDVKDTWRRTKLKDLKSGKWSQDEYQKLYDMVNLDLQLKISSEEHKKSKHGMLRDNIPWGAISDKLLTRNDASCCNKWYTSLCSSLVKENKWADADDYWMIGALYEVDASCVEDVDWENLLEHRDGEVCRKRWEQMLRLIEEPGSKTFAEQVEILAKRYRPELAEVREAWDKKPVVD